MTLAELIFRPGRRRFDRLTRPQLEDRCRHLEQQRDLAIGKTRAIIDQLAARLEQRADAHALDAKLAATPAARRDAHEWCADYLREEAREIQDTR